MKLSQKIRKSIFGYILILPTLITFGVFIYRPLLETLFISFHEWNMIGTKTYVGLNNYIELLGSKSFQYAFINTCYYAILLVVFVIILPTFVTAGIYYISEKTKSFYRVTIFTPAIISLGIASIVWSWIYNPIGGLIGRVLEFLGYTPINWLSSPRTALLAVVIVVTWKAFGYNLLLIMAGLTGIPDTVLDAARVDGATSFKLWFYIILPLISPTLLFVFIFTLSMSAEYVFTPIHVLTGGGPQNATTNLMFEIWRQAFQWFRVGTSSAIAIIVFIIFSVLMLLRNAISKKVTTYGEK